MNNYYFTGWAGAATPAIQMPSMSQCSTTGVIDRPLSAQLDVFGRLMLDRILFLGTPITNDVANIICSQMLYLAAIDPEKEISLYINSPGGDVSAGMAIYDTMKFIRPAVATVCVGTAASMAAVLLSAGEKGRRGILPHARVMIHQPVGAVKGQAADMAIAVHEIERRKQELYGILAECSGQPLAKLTADADRDFWMSSEEAVAYGVVDIVIGNTKTAYGNPRKQK